MTRGSALIAGVVVGLLVAMVATAVLVPRFPAGVRGATALWATAAGVVAFTAWLFWFLAPPRH